MYEGSAHPVRTWEIAVHVEIRRVTLLVLRMRERTTRGGGEERGGRARSTCSSAVFLIAMIAAATATAMQVEDASMDTLSSITTLTSSPSATFPTLSQTKCPGGCVCTADDNNNNGGGSLACAERSFLGLGLPRYVTNVSLKDVRAAAIPVAALETSAELRSLAWTSSGIESVEAGVFRATARLRRLDLGDNRLVQLPSDVFHPLHRLQYLNLTGNRLVALPRQLFHGLDSLQEIRLAANQLAVLPYQVFAPARELAWLDLSGNRLVSLPDHSFRPNGHLRELRLAGNRLTKLPSRLFSGLSHLRVLDLAGNEIHALPRGLFVDLVILEHLDLTDNPIARLADTAFQGLVGLRWLSLSRLPIVSLPVNVWRPVGRLRTLLLSGTKLENLRNGNLAGLAELETLEVTNSPLREIGHLALDETPSLRKLDLRHNDLTFLPANVARLSSLNELWLQGNPWACDCRMFWFVKWAESRAHLRAAFHSELKCSHDDEVDENGDDANANTLQTLRYLKCSQPVLVRATETQRYLLQKPVLLECEFNGNPAPSLTWVTPNGLVFHWMPDPGFPDAFVEHPHVHGWLDTRQPIVDDVGMRVLDNGSLYIPTLLREHVGKYKCTAVNPIANDTVYVTLHLDPITLHNIKLLSILVGASSAVAFLLLTLLLQLLRYLVMR